MEHIYQEKYMMIRTAKTTDKDWIEEIFAQNKKILGGAGYFGMQWHRYWNQPKSNEFWRRYRYFHVTLSTSCN